MVTTYILNQLLTSFFVFYTPLEKIFGQNEDFVAKVLAIGIILFINFLGGKFIVFKK